MCICGISKDIGEKIKDFLGVLGKFFKIFADFVACLSIFLRKLRIFLRFLGRFFRIFSDLIAFLRKSLRIYDDFCGFSFVFEDIFEKIKDF